jgi:hypothetical protein
MIKLLELHMETYHPVGDSGEYNVLFNFVLKLCWR